MGVELIRLHDFRCHLHSRICSDRLVAADGQSLQLETSVHFHKRLLSHESVCLNRKPTHKLVDRHQLRRWYSEWMKFSWILVQSIGILSKCYCLLIVHRFVPHCSWQTAMNLASCAYKFSCGLLMKVSVFPLKCFHWNSLQSMDSSFVVTWLSINSHTASRFHSDPINHIQIRCCGRRCYRCQTFYQLFVVLNDLERFIDIHIQFSLNWNSIPVYRTMAKSQKISKTKINSLP